jgi:hypothetical protein
MTRRNRYIPKKSGSPDPRTGIRRAPAMGAGLWAFLRFGTQKFRGRFKFFAASAARWSGFAVAARRPHGHADAPM